MEENRSPFDLTSSTEIRKLARQNVSELGNILQIGNKWKDLMGLIPGHPWFSGKDLPHGTNYPRKYTSEEIQLVFHECVRDGRTGFEVIIEEWGTSGKIRPKIQDLISLCEKACLERASVYLKNILNDAVLEATISGVIEESGNQLGICNNQIMDNPNDEKELMSGIGEVTTPRIPYSELLESVNAGIKIGGGAFGSVYKAAITIPGSSLKTVAIKLLNDSYSSHLVAKEKVFINEVKILSQCLHKNIIQLEAYSCCQNKLGLVYSYMENGSLYDRLACVNDTPPLSWKLRLRISTGTAEGIVYLHTNFSPPIIHRDVKSSNILLAHDFSPKLGDFGIVRAGGQGIHTNTLVNTTPIGTQMYMAAEAFRGDVSVKMDTFSYGIVLLELLTGLPYYDEQRENRDILSHVQEFEKDEILSLRDTAAGDWNLDLLRELFDFAEICTREKRGRPNMVQTLSTLKTILHKHEL